MSDDADLRGRVCIVTGATSGIGLETARGLAKLGAKVVLVGRDSQRLDRTCREIASDATASGPEAVTCDLSSQADIRRAATVIRSRHPRLDVLINNAGVVTRTRTLTADGIETQLAVNHLAPFLLTHLLIPALGDARPSRVVTVASAVESLGRMDFDDLGGERRYDANAAYCQSKLANVLFTRELARRSASSGVTANCLHPGAVATGLLAEYFGYARGWARVARLKYPGPVEGARSSIYLASSQEVAGETGGYFVDQRRVEPSRSAQDLTLAERLWSVSERLVQLTADERLPSAPQG